MAMLVTSLFGFYISKEQDSLYHCVFMFSLFSIGIFFSQEIIVPMSNI